MDRRDFIRLSAAAGGSAALTATGAASQDQAVAVRNERPSMTYRKLGRTDIVSSRLVFGCGAALAGGKAVRLLDRAYEAGINHFDVGSNVYYKGSEASLAPFIKDRRDDVWVLSKAPAPIRAKEGEPISVERAKAAAERWTRFMDESLKDLDTDYVDAYYLMGVDRPEVVRCEELYDAFLKAKSAGKAGYFGLSTHKNAQACLEAAIETGWYDLAMIGVTPAGWYDWDLKNLLPGTPTLIELAPLLERARAAGIGLVGLKTVRHLAPKLTALGNGDPAAFDRYYDEKFQASELSPFQRAYAYALEHGLDVVNADMQNFKHLEENIVAAAASHTYFA